MVNPYPYILKQLPNIYYHIKVSVLAMHYVLDIMFHNHCYVKQVLCAEALSSWKMNGCCRCPKIFSDNVNRFRVWVSMQTVFATDHFSQLIVYHARPHRCRYAVISLYTSETHGQTLFPGSTPDANTTIHGQEIESAIIRVHQLKLIVVYGPGQSLRVSLLPLIYTPLWWYWSWACELLSGCRSLGHVGIFLQYLT